MLHKSSRLKLINLRRLHAATYANICIIGADRRNPLQRAGLKAALKEEILAI